MPIRIPNDLPAASALRSENIFVMTDTRAKTQDIRPLKILLLNLMPTKIATETQLARLLGNTPIQVELELLMVKSHVAKNTSEEHMLAFYKTFDQVCGKTYDGMVITGAPVERMAFEDVGILGRAVRHLRVDENARHVHVPYLLGRAGGAVLPLGRAEVHDGEEAVRCVPSPRRA